MRADNHVYHLYDRYSVTVVTKNPDSDISERLMYAVPNIAYDRHYTADNLYHDIFTVWWKGEVPD